MSTQTDVNLSNFGAIQANEEAIIALLEEIRNERERAESAEERIIASIGERLKNLIDPVLSASSTHTVQNRIIKSALDLKQDRAGLAEVARSGSWLDLADVPTDIEAYHLFDWKTDGDGWRLYVTEYVAESPQVGDRVMTAMTGRIVQLDGQGDETENSCGIEDAMEARWTVGGEEDPETGVLVGGTCYHAVIGDHGAVTIKVWPSEGEEPEDGTVVIEDWWRYGLDITTEITEIVDRVPTKRHRHNLITSDGVARFIGGVVETEAEIESGLQTLTERLDNVNGLIHENIVKSYEGTVSSVDLTGATKIRAYAFYGMEELELLAIPYTVTSIGQNAFAASTIERIEMSHATQEAIRGMSNFPWGLPSSVVIVASDGEFNP